MKRFLWPEGWWLKRLAYLLAGTVLFTFLLSLVMARAASPTAEWQWAEPSAVALKRVSTVTGAQSGPNFLSNLDCSLITYRQPASSQMQTGCFTPTAFGWLDSDSDTVIFNDTDEGLPLLPYSNEVLVPWPQAADLVALNNANTGGTYISLYKNPLNHLQDQRNLMLQLTAKRLTTPPDLPLLDRAGQPLVVNPQTLAFSDGGSWLVAETLGGAFVRINLATLDMTAFASAFGSQGSPALLKSQVTVSSDGRYVAIANNAAGSFRVYDLSTCGGNTVNLQPENCKSHEYRPFVDQQLGGLQSIRHLRFVNDGLLSFEATAVSADRDGIYELAPTSGINSLIDYLGVGDSYTSGEGAFDYLAGTDSADNKCHLSLKSYPMLLTADLFSSRGGHSAACSGAVIKDVGSSDDAYRGQVAKGRSFAELQASDPALLASVMTNFLPGYVAQQRFVGQYQPGIVTVSVGGNDVGFGDMLARCVEPHLTRHESDNTCFNTYEDRLELTSLVDGMVPTWTALYKQLQAKSPVSRLYAIGYPDIVDDTGSCALNVHLGKSELEFTKEIVRYLNGAVRQAAARAGVTYIDIQDALVGHRLCETASYNVAVNGLTAGNDEGLLGIGVVGHESYHPNALGQRLIEQAILGRTHNFKDGLPATPVTNDSQSLLNAPKSGRAVNKRLVLRPPRNKAIIRNKPFDIKVQGIDYGLVAGSSYAVRLDGATGPLLATPAADTAADLSTTITIGPSVGDGSHTVDVVGQNQAGETVDISGPAYVGDAGDLDGDGLPDASDSCPAVANSGQDSDGDGIDDTCDGFIGAAGGGGSSTTATMRVLSADQFATNGFSIKVRPVVQPKLTVAPNPTSNPKQIPKQPAPAKTRWLGRFGLPFGGWACMALVAARANKRFSKRAGNRLE